MATLKGIAEKFLRQEYIDRDLAERAFQDKSYSHQCYWNDRLSIAILFDLRESFLQEAVSKVITNGADGYYEDVTHFGFPLTDILYSKGVNITPRPSIPSQYSMSSGYQHLEMNYVNSIIEIFKSEIILFAMSPKSHLNLPRR